MEEEDNQKDKYEDMTNNETGAQGVRDENVRHSYVITHDAQINMDISRRTREYHHKYFKEQSHEFSYSFNKTRQYNLSHHYLKKGFNK